MQDSNEFEYVGFWARVGAAIIDWLIIVVVTLPPLLWIYGWEVYFDESSAFIQGPADFIISWVLPTVAVILFWLYKQATPGKMAVRARVVDARTGNTISVGQAIGRYFAYIVSTLPLFLGLIWVGFDPRKQGWHDKLAGTVVIRAKHGGTEPVAFNS